MLIGLKGVKRSGKDTAALRMHEQFDFNRYAFADKLKDVARDLWDLSQEQVHGEEWEKEEIDDAWGVSPRHLMQVLGTEVARNAHKDTWIRWLHRNRLARPLSIGARCVVTDCRFLNEAQYIWDQGGKIIEIVRPDKQDSGDTHASEVEMKVIEPDYTIINIVDHEDLEGSLARFYAEVDKAMLHFEIVGRL